MEKIEQKNPGKPLPPLGPRKRCSKCGSEKPRGREFFGPAQRARDGLHSWCRECANADRSRRTQQRPGYGKRYGRTVAERFWSKVDRGGPDECWIWRGSLGHMGHGQFFAGKVAGRNYAASRYSLAMADGLVDDVGRVTTELHCLHKCDNPPCVNPAHLYWGTNDDNIADRLERGRSTAHHENRGERNGHARLSPEDVLEIRRRASTGETQSKLAQDFDVSKAAVNLIVLRKNWKHLPDSDRCEGGTSAGPAATE